MGRCTDRRGGGRAGLATSSWSAGGGGGGWHRPDDTTASRAGYEVRASEPDERMATRLRRRLPELGVHRASIADLPPPATRPCAIVAANVLHLSRDPAGALFALRARAGDDGMVAIVTPAPSATVRAVAQARRCAGDGRAAAAAFIACHILLAPLELAGRSCVDHDRLADALESVEWRECREVRGISRVVSFPGLTGASRAGSST